MSEKETLRTLSENICRKIDVGTAVLPKPLFTEYDDDQMGCATVACAASSDDPDISSSGMGDTTYAKIVSSEFNSIVVEHHLKWAPLCETLPGPIDEKTPSNRLGRYDFSHVDRIVDWAIDRK